MSEIIEHRPQAAAGTHARIWNQLQSLLVPGEAVGAYAVQHRLYALTHRRHVAAATSGRYIFLTRPLLGGYKPQDVRWQDLKAARITVGMFSAAVEIDYSSNMSDTAGGEGQVRTLRASGMTISEAQALYRECQAQEQTWREKRRVRTIEEMRAQAGGVQIATGVYPQGGDAGAPRLAGEAGEDPAQRLARAKAMLDQGLITDAEYEAIKAKVVGAL